MSTVNGPSGSTSTTGRGGNVSVTNINCENDGGAIVGCSGVSSSNVATSVGPPNGGFYTNGGIRISVPKMEESDDSETELSNIDKNVVGGGGGGGGGGVVNMRSRIKTQGPRPMSWEGELSETEDVSMDIENGASNDGDAMMGRQDQQAGGSDDVEPPDPPKLIQLPNHTSEPGGREINPINFTVDNNNPILLAKESIKCEVIESSPPLDSGTNDDNNAVVSSSFPNCGIAGVHNNSNTSGNGSNSTSNSNKKYHPDIANLKYEPGLPETSAHNSPLLARSKSNFLPANPSPDSAIHSVYTHSSPSQSPLTSRHAPYTPTLSRNNSDASYSSCYSYSSEFSPTHSPIQARHPIFGSNAAVAAAAAAAAAAAHLHPSMYKSMYEGPAAGNSSTGNANGSGSGEPKSDDVPAYDSESLPSAGISRQQLINSPCPICGDKISGFHYGIFSCESCKGFFKRTVQNRKNYVCLRGAVCPVTIATRKKCPACRFEKCLQRGMKLEAIREDRTRGGRSTYQCSYTLPSSMLSPSSMSSEAAMMQQRAGYSNGPHFKAEPSDMPSSSSSSSKPGVPSLLQEIMDVEHLWQYNEAELSRLNQPPKNASTASLQTNPLLASAGLNGENSNPDMIVNLCNIADHRLYKIVKWCKSLPLFKNISIDDQICLLINSWCELLLFSCCFRSIASPGEIRISLGKSITLTQAKASGLQACIERMLNLTDYLRRLRVDRYEYVAMKVIVLLSSDTSELKEPEKVRASQEKALQALQAYTLGHYPDMPAKFGELLLRIPELQRTCQLGKEMLTIKSKEGEEPSFNLLMELLRGEH